MTEATIRNKPGMASVKDMPLLQDGPPPGGFAPVRYARRIPSKGPSAVAIFFAAFGTFSWGMYEVGKGNKIRRYFPLITFLFIFIFISYLFGDFCPFLVNFKFFEMNWEEMMYSMTSILLIYRGLRTLTVYIETSIHLWRF